MKPFVFNGQPSRVVFGIGALDRLAEEIERLGAKRALVLSTPEQRASAEDVRRAWASARPACTTRPSCMFRSRRPKPRARWLRGLDADCCVAIGGGSTIGLGKAIALTSELPILAIPTTFAGSEMTPIYGITAQGQKKTGRDARVLPKTVIYDPNLLRTLPARIAGPSGMNAIAHCVEALYAEDANPIVSLMAEEGIRALAMSLPAVVHEPGNLEARSDALYGAWLGGRVPRTSRDGLASQAVPHARRVLQPAARRDAHRGPAARGALQPRGGARGDGARGAGAGCAGCTRRLCTSWLRAWAHRSP